MANEPGEQISLIISDPSFRIFTTLRHNQFNQVDLQNSTPTITAWKTADAKLLDLHSGRLQASAQAFNWTEVATLFEQEGKPLLSKHLDLAVARLSASVNEPAQGYCRALRAHIDVSRDAGIDVSLIAMGEDKRLSFLETDCFHILPPPTPSPASRSLQSPSPDSALAAPPEYSQITVDSEPTPVTLFTAHKTSHRLVYDAARTRASITPCSPLAAEVLLYNEFYEITEASVSTVYLYRGGRWITPAAECGGNLSVTRRLALEGGFCVEGRVLIDDVRDGEIIWLSNAARGFFMGRVSR
jgi:4-amino-4-deoxychorismate lyase